MNNDRVVAMTIFWTVISEGTNNNNNNSLKLVQELSFENMSQLLQIMYAELTGYIITCANNKFICIMIFLLLPCIDNMLKWRFSRDRKIDNATHCFSSWHDRNFADVVLVRALGKDAWPYYLRFNRKRYTPRMLEEVAIRHVINKSENAVVPLRAVIVLAQNLFIDFNVDLCGPYPSDQDEYDDVNVIELPEPENGTYLHILLSHLSSSPILNCSDLERGVQKIRLFIFCSTYFLFCFRYQNTNWTIY